MKLQLFRGIASFVFAALLIVVLAQSGFGQSRLPEGVPGVNPALLDGRWTARWIYPADTPGKKSFSQHANALAVIAGVIQGSEARDLVLRTLQDRTLARCSYYFRYYLNQAVIKVGEGNRYLGLLEDWQTMLDSGLTTWAERPEGAGNPARSDCHAWSAHPNVEIFRTVLGVDTAAPGFEKVIIRPFPGDLRRLSGRVPHPRGEISARLEVDGAQLTGEVVLPAGVEGSFEWNGQTKALGSGRSTLRF